MKKTTHQSILVFFLILLGLFGLCCLFACQETYTPKPRAYPRIILPAHDYQAYQPADCPFAFEQGTYAKIIKDTLFFKRKPEHPCWIVLDYPTLNASMYLSYKKVKKEKGALAKLVEDAYKLNAKHVLKADFIDDSLIVTKNGVYGMYFNVGGNAASSTQFFLTDSVEHFIWASLYVKATPNEDSIAPLTNFLKEDVRHFIHSFKWKEEGGS